MTTTKQSKRYGARNHAMILLAYRHGLRASEVVPENRRALERPGAFVN